MDAPVFGVVAAAALLAGFTQSFAGFGSTLVAIPLLGLVLDVRAAVPLGCLMALSINVLLVSRLGRQAKGASLLLLLAAALPGIGLGFLFVTGAPEPLLKAVLGASVLLMALRPQRRECSAAPLAHRWAVIAGLTSGCMGASLGINGPPIVTWAVRQPWSRETIKATMTAYFLCAGVVIVTLQLSQGLISGQVFALYVKTLPFLLAGFCAGWVSCGKVNDAVFRRTVLSLLAATALALLWQAGAKGLEAWPRS